MVDKRSHISWFARSDGADGPDFSNDSGTANISELRVPSIICLAGHPRDDTLPAVNFIRKVSHSRTIMALAPDQWLISDAGKSADELLAEVQSHYARHTVVCADHSDAWNILRLSGAAAAKCLSRLCPVDLHPLVFGKDQLIQTNMAGIYILCTRTAGQDQSFDLYMSNSYSRSFYEILRDAVQLG